MSIFGHKLPTIMYKCIYSKSVWSVKAIWEILTCRACSDPCALRTRITAQRDPQRSAIPANLPIVPKVLVNYTYIRSI